jgi:cobaltochelatase CobS
MIVTISKHADCRVSLAEFEREVRWLPDVGPKGAWRLYNGDLLTITIEGDKAEIAMKRLKSLIEKRFLISDSPNAAMIVGDNPAPFVDLPIQPPMENQPMNNPAPAATPAPGAMDIGNLLAAAVLPAIQAQMQKLVDEAVGARVPREIVIKAADKPDVKMDGHVHPAFEKVLRLVKANVGVMLIGPAGCGKTHLFSQVCQALNLEGESISLSGGVTEAHLTGRLLPTGEGGRFVYTESPFVKCYREGRPFLIDEMDGGDPNVLLSINQATANGGFHVEARAASGLDTFVKRHPDTVLMATANTYGTGAGAMYVGRNQLDAATLDRWYIVNMDYDKAFEERIAPSQVTHFVWRLRELIQHNKWRRVASTRMIQKASAALGAGLKWQEVKADLLSGYTADELSKINF